MRTSSCTRIGRALQLLLKLQLFAVILLPLQAQAASTDCAVAEAAIQEASRIRGLKIKQKVPCRLQNRDEVEQYLRDAITKKNPTKKLENEERILKLLGLIPKDFDYVGGLIKLYTEQLGGYYDPERKYYAMAAWIPGALQAPVAVHELTHALQDQYYDLQKLLDEKRDFGDVLMARLALVEGDATAVMMDYSRRMTGQPPIEKDADVSGFMMQSLVGSMLSPGVAKAPAALQAMMIFPYASGLNFVHKQLKKGQYRAIDDVFRRPPSSTEEILHPEKYRGGLKDFVDLEPVPVASKPGDTGPSPVHTDRQGEFVISTLLATWLSPAVASVAAAGWGGDILALYDTGGKFGSLTWLTAWDTAKDADEFYEAFKEAYAKRFAQTLPKTGDTVSFDDVDFGKVTITKQEQRVLLTIE